MVNVIRICIDPGEKGGIAWRYADGTVRAEKMPDTCRGLADLLRSLPGPKEAMIEQVNAMPSQGGRRKMGAVSAMSFGKQVGKLEMAMAAFDISFRYEVPQTWLKRIPGLPVKPALVIPPGCSMNKIEDMKAKAAERHKAARKAYLKQYAQRLFPHIKVTLMTSDALCMLSVWAGPVDHPGDEEL